MKDGLIWSRGIVRCAVWKRGWPLPLYLGKGPNQFVNGSRSALAALLGGGVALESAVAIGFGSGANAPQATDTKLTAPAYYKAISSHTEDGGGGVSFGWFLAGPGGAAHFNEPWLADPGAVGIAISEMGLFANVGNLALPGSVAPGPLIARKTIAPFMLTANLGMCGTWTLTF